MKPFTVVLTGNPNCGKTTLFNALTGLRGRVGNYAGVTVERKEGSLTGADARFPVTILDLPGTYSLSPQSPDEQIARDILFQRAADVPAPDLVVVVVDASNLQRNLYFATQVIELGHPTLLTLNMVDVARDQGHDIDTDALSKALGVPVIPMVASQGEGLEPLRHFIRSQASSPGTRHVIPREFNELPEAFGREAQAIETALERHFPHRSRLAAAEALLLLSDERALPTDKTNTDGNTNGNTANTRYPSALIEQVLSARRRLEAAGVDWRSTAIEARYARLFAIEQHVTRETPPPDELLSDRIDRVVTHRVWGPLIFVTVMALMFQSIFWLAQYPMDGIEAAVDALAQWVGSSMPPGDLNDLITRGAIAGVGSVVIFLPQICLLFLFIGLLEDTGYMSRAAFLMDRLMSRVGLHGKSFIPMLSSFACAIPGIMATRTIETRQDRLATILVAPLMSCSARLPVYTVLRSTGHGLDLQEDPPPRRTAHAHPRITALQTAHAGRGASANVGSFQALPETGGHGDLGNQHPALVPRHLPPLERAPTRVRPATRPVETSGLEPAHIRRERNPEAAGPRRSRRETTAILCRATGSGHRACAETAGLRLEDRHRYRHLLRRPGGLREHLVRGLQCGG